MIDYNLLLILIFFGLCIMYVFSKQPEIMYKYPKT